MAERDDDVEALYAVPTHLSTSGSIGPIPQRAFYVYGMAIILGGLPALLGYKRWGWPGALLGLIPLILSIPWGLWFLEPPPEHGMGRWIAFRFARKVLHPQHQTSTRALRIEGAVVYTGKGEECRGILAMPTINLELASLSSRRRHRRQLGALLDGISTHQVQILVRAEVQSQASATERMRLHRNLFSRKLAVWLEDHHKQKQSIDRRRYLIIPATNAEALEERIGSIERSFRQAGLEAARVEDPADLRDLINRWWTWRPHDDRLGPERIERRAKDIQCDGELARVYAMSKLPSTIVTNWWYRLIDGDLPCDISITLHQQELSLAKWRLDLRYNDLASSSSSAANQIALAQVKALRTAFEGRIRPWDAQILLVVRGADYKALEYNARRLEQQMRDLGATVNLLKWEQYEGMVAAQPLCMPFMPRRHMYLESGTLARTTPFAASTLQMRDGVPWGLAGSTPIQITTRGVRTGRHFGWYGWTGSGKGFGVRCYLTRRHYADRLRIFVWDADEAQHEYADRWCTMMQGIRLEPRSLEDVRRLEFDPLWQIVVLDVTGMPDGERSAAFAVWKNKVQAHVLEFPGDTAFVVDEATTLAYDSDPAGALALGDAVQRWRKMGIEVHVLTQRVSDWFGTAIGRKIQGNLAVKWYGAQEDSELEDVARKVNLSTEERDRIGAAGIGQGLLVAFGRRVWADLYDHTSPDEYQAYHTDPPDKVELLTRRVA